MTEDFSGSFNPRQRKRAFLASIRLNEELGSSSLWLSLPSHGVLLTLLPLKGSGSSQGGQSNERGAEGPRIRLSAWQAQAGQALSAT